MRERIRKNHATRFDADRVTDVYDKLVLEAPLHICVNGESLATTMRTPGDDESLARGLLFTEGILGEGAAPLHFKTAHDPENGIVARIDVAVDREFLAKPVAGRRSLLASASCGVCGTRDPGDITVYGDPISVRGRGAITLQRIESFLEQMREGQQLYTDTGGAHGAALFDNFNELLCVREDIGRHNAVDKAIGHVLSLGHVHCPTCLTVSGRVSYEIIYKAYRAAIPIVISVGAASSMAVDTADRLGITLAAFCRGGRATVYTHSERVVSAQMADHG